MVRCVMRCTPVALPPDECRSGALGLSLELLLAAAGAAAAGLLVLDRATRRSDFVLLGLVMAVGWLPVLGGIVEVLQAPPPPDPISGAIAPRGLSAPKLLIGRAQTLTLLVTVGICLLRPSRTRRGRGLFLGAAAYGTTTIAALVAADAVDEGAVRSALGVALGLVAVTLAPRLEPMVLATWGKRVLTTYLVASLVAFVVGAPFVSEPAGDGSVLPFVDFRLQGIAGHPNRFGPLLVLYLVFERLVPSRPLLRWGGIVTAVVLLVLSQSKTSWFAALVVLGIHLWADHPRQREALVLTVTCALAAVALLISVSGLSLVDVLDPQTAQRAVTLSSRTTVWTVGLEVFREHAVFGGGPRVFEDYARATGLSWIGHAHNQVVQVLAEQGLVGLVGFVVFVIALVRSAARTAVVSRLTSVSLLAVVLVGSITETPLSSFSLDVLLVLGMLVAWERTPAPVELPQRAAPRRELVSVGPESTGA